ncbi:MAG: hypothetical protein DBX59_08170 [Bacillota bacterium]|nr:MAG: hypothetical protein DBX59_08170 [Bacillota bacterium]
MDWTNELIYLLRILLAVLLGFCIGFERKMRFKEAGIRTHTIVCAGAALIMIVSKYGFADVPDFDASRVAAQIVSGIGFIGAGMIIYRKTAIYGLTTAAGVWATAGVGMAVGSGLYIVSVGATILLITVQCIMHIRCKLFKTKTYWRLRVRFEQTEDENETVREIFAAERFERIQTVREGDLLVCDATINTDKNFTAGYISEILKKYPFIRSIERCGDE